ncbi:MAG: hypothetical protein RJB01_1021 [Actinomycetota bacterium]|jgi:NADPH2:quinone reductase
MSTMRAATYSKTGPATDVLTVKSLPLPKPGPHQVRVKLAFSGVNPTDVKSRAGLTPRSMGKFQIPHHDGAGVIDVVGASVDPSRIGERVWVMLAADNNAYGTAAEYCVVDVKHVLPLPADVPFEMGATLGVPAVTAAYCLFADGPIDGQQVLIHGGAGGVGRAAIQLAKWAGATVLATASTPEKQVIAREAGADFVFDYRDPDVAESIRAVAPKIRRIIEVNLNANMDLDLAVSNPGTVIVVYAADGEDPVLPRRRFMSACVTLQFMLLYNTEPQKFTKALEATQEALAAGALTMPPVRYFGITEIVDAHLAQEAGPESRILIDLSK